MRGMNRSGVGAGAASSGRALVALLVAALGTPAVDASAQTLPYQVVTEAHPYESLTNGIAVSPPLGDGNVFELLLPFQFTLYGVPHNRMWINANGFVSFRSVGAGHHFAPRNNPNPPAPNGFIAALWSDWCSSFGGPCANPQATTPQIGVYYAIDDNPGNGSVAIEWRAVRHYSDVGAPSASTFQIKLYEGPAGQIELSYGEFIAGRDFGGNPVRVSARIGIEAADATEGQWVGPCSGATPCLTAEVESLANTRISILVDAGDDITFAGVSVPSTGFPGLPLPVSARYVSRHGDPLGPTSASAVLVPRSATSTSAGRVLWTSQPMTLAPYESRLLSFDLEVPGDLLPGHYRLAMVADYQHQLTETDETNNVVWSTQTIRIAGRAPDFRVASITSSADRAAPGDTLELGYTLENAGNEPGDLSFAVYLSSNEAISDQDLMLGQLMQVATVSRQVVTGTLSATLPSSLPTGTYYLGLIVDAEGLVAELDETNNIGRARAPIDVHSSQVVIVTDSLPPATLTRSYSGRIQALGGDGTFTFRLTDGSVPRGLMFNASLGELFGIPLEIGRFPLEFEARSGRISTRKLVTLDVVDPQVALTILTSRLPSAVAHADYAVTPRTVGGTEPFRWRVLGHLPEGLVVATDGTILGVPRRPGTTQFGLEVSDNAAATATVGLTLEVRAPSNLSITSSALPEGRIGDAYTQQLNVRGGVKPYRWEAITAPPAGLVISEDGVVGGVPEAVGRYRIQVQVRDAVASVDTNVLTVEVTSASRFFIKNDALEVGKAGEGYRAVLSVEGGMPPFRWSIVEGDVALPLGISARPGMPGAGQSPEDFIIEGVFDGFGIWAFTVRCEDARNQVTEKPFALVVPAEPEPPPTVIDDKGCACSTPRTGFEAWGVLVLFLLSIRNARRS